MAENNFSDQTYLKNSQYKNDANLNARITLHKYYSVNPLDWQPWVFEQANIQEDNVILEAGCGPGNFWGENLANFPQGIFPVLSDFSFGMVKKASQLKADKNGFSFSNLDIMNLPFQDQAFDRVIANHMLYHVPDIPLAIQEVNRVLKRDGIFIAATNGENHMKEIFDLAQHFYPEKMDFKKPMRGFTLENGETILREKFDSVELILFEDAIKVPVVEPVVNYILSMISVQIREEDASKLGALIMDEIKEHGVFTIQKASGVFIARQPKN